MKSMIHKGDIANKIKKLKNSMREDFSGNWFECGIGSCVFFIEKNVSIFLS
jgi:hypothetical protein